MERWAQVKRLHQDVLDVEPDQRAAFLDAACEGDVILRREVESLLTYQETAEPFMEVPAIEVAARSLNQEPSLSLVGRSLGHYQVRSLLGVGGMGEVYLAYDPRLERAVALKVLPPDFADDADRMSRFVRETRTASALNHPNVATVHDVGESDGLHFIVMEYVEGETLAARITLRPLTATEIVDIAIQIGGALEAAHAKGIAHRDIKPANVMLTPRGQVKVLDFGVAKTRRSDDRGSSGDVAIGKQTAAGRVIGSVPYMSPEQVLGHDVDWRSDLFSLGVTLYELATGQLPFNGVHSSETMSRILRSQPVAMRELRADLPREFERITRRCLEKEIDRRYQSASDLLADLRHLKRRTDEMPTRRKVQTNLPAPLTSFVGRRREVEDVHRVLEGARLLTLTGAGGCGKTRLAMAVAAQLVDEFHDGVWAVDVGPLSDATLIPNSVAAVLGIREGSDRSVEEALIEFFRPRHLLLMFDNCEHLIAACARLVERLLHAAPRVSVLATSREGLGIQGETLWRVPSMSTPASSATLEAEPSLQYEAIRLFADRASAAQSAFRVTNENAAKVAEICRRLDGIPLAIELAAARLNVLSVDQIAARLNDRFRLLTGGSRTAVARQRTLEATIDWSYDLLSEPERTVLRRLSIFPAGWTVEAAEQVCTGHGIDRNSTLDLLSNLVDKSLVNVEDDPTGGRRYRCLETVRQYGRERLIKSGDAERVRDAHLRFFLAFVRRAEPELQKAAQATWLKRLQADYDNLRAALEWCLDPRVAGETGLGMTTAMQWFWIKRGYLAEGRQWLERALATGQAPPGLKAKALNGLASVTFFLGDYAATKVATESSLACSREVDDHGEMASSLGIQSIVAFESGDVASSVQLARACREAATISGELWRQGPAVECVAYQAMMAGDGEQACRLAEESLAMCRHMGDTWGIAISLSDVALFQVLQGRYAEAETLCAEALALSAELDDRLLTAFFLSILAGAQAGQDRLVRAVRLWGAMHALLESVAAPLQRTHKMWIGDRFISPIEVSLGATGFHRALEEGRALSLNQAVQYAQGG